MRSITHQPKRTTGPAINVDGVIVYGHRELAKYEQMKARMAARTKESK